MKNRLIILVLIIILILCSIYLYNRHFRENMDTPVTGNREQTSPMFNFLLDLTADEHVIPSKESANMEDIRADASASVYLKYPAETPTGYVYLALENTAEMSPSIRAEAEGDSARFTNLRKDLMYCPVYCVNGKQTAAGDPFWLDGGGRLRFFNSDSPEIQLILNKVTPNEESYTSKIHAGQEYELFLWKKDSWQSLGKQRATGKTLEWKAPPQALFRLDNKSEHKKGTVFYMEENCQVFWRAKNGNIVRCKQVRVSEVRNNIPAEQGKNAIDGKIDGNRWVAAGEGAHWIELEFEKSALISSFRIITGNSQGKAQSGYEAQKFEFQAWNGSAWTTLISEIDNTECTYTSSFLPLRTKRVRLVTYGDTRLIEIETYEISKL